MDEWNNAFRNFRKRAMYTQVFENFFLRISQDFRNFRHNALQFGNSTIFKFWKFAPFRLLCYTACVLYHLSLNFILTADPNVRLLRGCHCGRTYNVCACARSHIYTYIYIFVHWGLKLVQLVKTAPKHDRCIEDLGDDILRRAYLDFIYVLPIVLWGTCKAQWVGLLVY